MASLLSVLDVAFGVLGFFLIARLLTRKNASMPPGPKALPIIGNILDMPSSKEWLTYSDWARVYGDLVSVTVLGQPIIVLNSWKVAVDMLERKSSLYSDRPVLTMGGELCGWKNTLALTPYGDRFRNYRRYCHKLLGTHSSMSQFHPVEEEETRRFLRCLLSDPTGLRHHIRHTAGAIILRIAYGYHVLAKDDPLVDLVDRAIEKFSESSAPGIWLVDVLPVLKHVPSWFPGATFKRLAASWYLTLQDMADKPFELVKAQMAAGTAAISFTSTLLDETHGSIDAEFDIKWSAASLYSGGADTTVSAIYSFFLAMLLYPEVQEKAQAEIDAVVGSDRLPSFDDRDRLPYVDALVKEVLRWNAVAPQSVPHRVIAEDMHDGYFIPKGSIIIANIDFMLKDPRVYKDAEAFNPDRFIPTSERAAEKDPREICFGFGRRICPGLNLADASVFISCAMSLAVFHITKAVKDGKVIEPVHDKTSGVISHPVEFDCHIQPRSEKAAALIMSQEDD